MSLSTVAETEAVPPTSMEVGGAVVMVRVMSGVSDCDDAFAPQPALPRPAASAAAKKRSPAETDLTTCAPRAPELPRAGNRVDQGAAGC